MFTGAPPALRGGRGERGMIIQTTDNGRNGRWPTFSEVRKALPQGPRGKWIFSPRADAEKAYLPDAGFCLRYSILRESFLQVRIVNSGLSFGRVTSPLCSFFGPDSCKYFCVLFSLPQVSTCREGKLGGFFLCSLATHPVGG